MLKKASDFDNIYVSYFRDIYNSHSTTLNITRVLNGIRSNCFKTKVLKIRELMALGQQDDAKRIKNSLHAVTFCGLFPTLRKSDACEFYNSIIVIDIDKLQKHEFESVAENLMNDKYIAAFWISPSGKGYKGLVHVLYDDDCKSLTIIEKHKLAFRSLYKYLKHNYEIELDRSGSDITRLCFMSWDTNLILKDSAESFLVNNCVVSTKNSKKVRENIYLNKDLNQLKWNDIIGEAKNYVNHRYYRFKLTSIYKKLLKRNISITDTYENWVKVAYAIASNIHPEKGRELFLKLCELDGEKNNKSRSEKLIFDAYASHKGCVSFNTIIYLARQKGLEVN